MERLHPRIPFHNSERDPGEQFTPAVSDSPLASPVAVQERAAPQAAEEQVERPEPDLTRCAAPALALIGAPAQGEVLEELVAFRARAPDAVQEQDAIPPLASPGENQGAPPAAAQEQAEFRSATESLCAAEFGSGQGREARSHFLPDWLRWVFADDLHSPSRTTHDRSELPVHIAPGFA